jgi:ribosome biogenesis GTPase
MTGRTEAECDGLVIANFGQTVLIEDRGGEPHRCVARKAVGPIVCGDRVGWIMQPDGSGVVTAVRPRDTLIERCDDRGRVRPMCANVDRFLIVGAVRAGASGERPLSGRDLLDCYLAAAEIRGITAVIVVNKIDLLERGGASPLHENGEASPDKMEIVTATMAPYHAAGYPVFYVSAKTGEGLPELRERLCAHRSVLVGESGVGKSSLIKALLPDRDIRIGELAAAGGMGRHTTTATVLFHLPGGGDIMDSPGVREFGLWNLEPSELASGFREFQPRLGSCRYRDCRHLDEPGCAIAAAAAKGLIAQARLDAYRRIFRSLTARR